ncbi:helix-turn-helix transcriptional regulator [Sinanaerobacter sp. ZZT-01]|uniref:helix-turn-helix transcriptional regulator n=1 Tax=Sinanaerobacter sp. ZZT-01 TaxID=3111540 RepID=UPI002D796281|nr:helix-turn-helix transcriptional regulator [Sinanaerobacter sp. ZZT-01]WRR94231.1 helix-turn-helix transcriptional regulator [Sinanaerobacter sp. ZZT-01]
MNTVLKELRLNSHLSHKEMGQVIGKTASAYYKKEQGSIPFSLKEAKLIADFYKKSIEDTFFNKINGISKTYSSLDCSSK